MFRTQSTVTLICDRCGAELDDPGEDGTTPPAGQVAWLAHLAVSEGWALSTDGDRCGACTGYTDPQPDPDTRDDETDLGFIVWYDTGDDADYCIFTTLADAVEEAANWRRSPGLVGQEVHISRQHVPPTAWNDAGDAQTSWYEINDRARLLYTWVVTA